MFEYFLFLSLKYEVPYWFCSGNRSGGIYFTFVHSDAVSLNKDDVFTWVWLLITMTVFANS